MTARDTAGALHADAQRASIMELAGAILSGAASPVMGSVLAGLVIEQDRDLAAGGLLPSAWAGPPRRPVADVPLPGDAPPPAAATEEFRAGARRRHRQVPSRRGRAASCALDGQPWPCEAIVLLGALDAAGPGLRVLEEYRDLLGSALADAIEHREETVACPDCAGTEHPCFDQEADAAKAEEYDRLRGQLRELP